MIRRLTAYWRLHRVPILLVTAGLVLYYVFAYQLERADTIRLFSLYAALFFFCFKLIQFEKWNLKFLVVSGVLFRLVFLLAIPNLSQDFYRFIWDGRVILAGMNPYLLSPDSLIEQGHPAVIGLEGLHQGMGSLSAGNFSNYPPLNQMLFALAVLVGGKGILGPVVAIRCMLVMADLGVLYFGRELLKKINRSPHLIFWYFLNPLVIIELTGNLHFEGVMLFLFIAAIYLLLRSSWFWAAILFAASIALKLVPLIFLPLVLPFLGLKKSLKFYLVLGMATILFILPFLAPGAGMNYAATIKLWFSNFEFNAGLYNLVKYLGGLLDIRPWELIKTYGQIMPLITFIFVLILTFFRKNQKPEILLSSMLWALSCYYLLSPTVHPWYITSIILLCIYGEFRFPLFWSALAILSYSAYANPDFKENSFLLGLEYIVVIGIMLYEIVRIRGDYFSFRKN